MRKLVISVAIILFSYTKTNAPPINEEFLYVRFITVTTLIENKIKEQERIKLILKTLRILETNENYNLFGKSGEYGAYQFTPSTWKWYCHVFFKETLDIFIPENQDKVAEAKIKMLIKNGFTDEEIASFWNSGKKNWIDNKGVNKYGVKYDTPKYVKSFMRIKNNL